MSTTWMKRLRDALEEIGYSFEAEESVRIHVGDVIVEVGVEDGRYAVTVSVPLPPSSSDESEVGYYSRLYEQALKILLGLRGDVRYEVDTSLPEYPSLHMTRVYEDPDRMVDELVSLLRKLREEIPPSEAAAEA